MKKNRIINLIFVSAALLSALPLLPGCYTAMSGSGNSMTEASAVDDGLIPGQFGNMWRKNTIILSPPGGQRSAGMPLMMGAGGRGGGITPMRISATFMDSVLINTGISVFSLYSHMTNDEAARFRIGFDEKHKPEKYYYVWMEMETFYTPEILNTSRWNIFWEDEKGNQYEPYLITEFPQDKNLTAGADAHAEQSGRRTVWKMSKKVYQLYFPKQRVDGNPVLTPDTRQMKLVVLNWRNPEERYEGTWAFPLHQLSFRQF